MPTLHPAPDGECQDAINGQLYGCADLVGHYAAASCSPPEATALIRYRDFIAGRRVLDLGCGAGRLAIYLRPFAAHYVGFDISPHMIDHCRRQFPELEFCQGDMRDLSRFSDGSFDAIFAIFNLFDAVAHADRLRIFAGVRRILTPGGLLVFSAHNRNSAQLNDGPHLRRSRNPVTQLQCIVEYVQARINHQRIKRHQHFEDAYALVNDSGHNYAVLHYYIDRRAQALQLNEVGFHLLETLDEAGRTLGPDQDDSANASIHYIARPSA